MITLTVTLTDEAAARTGVAAVTRTYVGANVRLLSALEDLLEVSGVSSTDVVRVDVS